MGLIGLLTCQLLKANGINVLAVDTDIYKCEIADSLGIKALHLCDNSDPLNWCYQETNFFGVDGVIITASTESNEPLKLAAKSCRKRGRIILVGQIGSNIDRDLFSKCINNHNLYSKQNRQNFCLDKYKINQIISNNNFLIDNKNFKCDKINIPLGSRNPLNRGNLQRQYCKRENFLK